jgi:hypothetical protein
MVDRVERDRGDAHLTEFNIWKYLALGKDWKIWCFAANFGFAGLVVYSVAYFLPIIMRDDLGFSVVMSQCLTAPVRSVTYSVLRPDTDAQTVLCLLVPARSR